MSGQHVEVWEIWRNPLLIRFVRSRLRPRRALIWLLITFVFTAFVFTLAYVPSVEREMMTQVEAARTTLIPLFVIQGIILMLMGTGAVASGVVQEKITGTLDYQRLTPMAPSAKIIGYLFGLPIREYAMVAITLPFTAFALFLGKIPASVWVPVYAVFFSSVLLYHMTGFVAAMITAKWKGASKLSQGLVIVLNWLLPAVSNLGFIFLEYLTVRPVIQEKILPLVEGAMDSPGTFPVNAVQHTVPLYQFELSVTAFSLLIQGLLLVTFFVIVRRKWIQSTNHILSKTFALGFLAVFCFLLMGNLWPTLTRAENAIRLIFANGDEADQAIAIALPIFFVILMGALSFLLVVITTPSRHEFIRGWRRARKLKLAHPPLQWDEAGNLFHLAAIGAFTIGTYSLLVYLLRSNGFTATIEDYMTGIVRLGLTYTLATVYFWLMVEYLGIRRSSVLIIIVWVVPVLVAIVMAAARNELGQAAIYASSPSPVAVFILSLPVPPEAGDAPSLLQAKENAYMIGTGIMLLASGFLFYRLQQYQAKVRDGSILIAGIDDEDSED